MATLERVGELQMQADQQRIKVEALLTEMRGAVDRYKEWDDAASIPRIEVQHQGPRTVNYPPSWQQVDAEIERWRKLMYELNLEKSGLTSDQQSYLRAIRGGH